MLLNESLGPTCARSHGKRWRNIGLIGARRKSKRKGNRGRTRKQSSDKVHPITMETVEAAGGPAAVLLPVHTGDAPEPRIRLALPLPMPARRGQDPHQGLPLACQHKTSANLITADPLIRNVGGLDRDNEQSKIPRVQTPLGALRQELPQRQRHLANSVAGAEQVPTTSRRHHRRSPQVGEAPPQLPRAL